MASDPAAHASRVVARLTHRGPELGRLRGDLDRALRALIGWDVAAWATTDPATLLFTSCVVFGREEDPAVEARLFELEFAADDVNTFVDLARAPVPAASLCAATAGAPGSSRRYRDLLAPLGFVDELRAAFVEHGQCWGTLCAYRASGPAFTARDAALLAAVAPAIASGLRVAMLHTALRTSPQLGPSPGVVLVDEHGAVIDVSPQARHWLDTLDRPGALPSVLRSVAAATRIASGATGPTAAPGGDPAAGPPAGPSTSAQARLPGSGGGWIRLHGTLLEASGHVAVVVEPATEVHLADVLVRAYALTRRERQITELVAQGHATTDIAEALFITPYTVQDHLKSILAKTGTANRRELVAALHGRHYAPATRTGASPSPYGWYLDR